MFYERETAFNTCLGLNYTQCILVRNTESKDNRSLFLLLFGRQQKAWEETERGMTCNKGPPPGVGKIHIHYTHVYRLIQYTVAPSNLSIALCEEE